MTEGRRKETLSLTVETPNNRQCWMAPSATFSQPEGIPSPLKDLLPPTHSNGMRWYRITSQ